MSTTMDQTSRRQVWRRRLVVAGLVPLLAAVALTVKVGLMVGYDRGGRSAYDDAAFADARSSFAANAVLNWFEPWISPFDEGTTSYRLKDFDGAVALYRVALADVPAGEECRVRVNLALALEARGDRASAQGRPQDSRAEWQAALDDLADGGCLDPEGANAPAGDMGAAEAVSIRVREKLAGESEEAPEPPEPPSEQEPPPPPTPEQQEQLDEQNEQAKDQRRQEQERREQRQRPAPEDPQTSEW